MKYPYVPSVDCFFLGEKAKWFVLPIGRKIGLKSLEARVMNQGDILFVIVFSPTISSRQIFDKGST